MQRVVRFWFPFQISLVAASLFLYLGYSLHYGGLGFPLDDSWIHQTFARNLALYGQWAYNPGEVSAGSTSPLWTILLSPGYLLPLDHRVWTYLLGAIFLSLTGWIARRFYLALFPRQEGLSYLLGLFLPLEWHLVWAAVSGMETILFIFLSLLLLERHLREDNPFLLGLLGGLLILTRPEGIILLCLVALDRVRRHKLPALWAKSLAWLLLGFALLFAPYLAFHLLVAGHPLPNTFYAKYAEYRAQFDPLLLRCFTLPGETLKGAQILLLPGFLWAVYSAIRTRRWNLLLSLGWWASFLSIYIFYLPLTYQHGRYLMPTIPLLVILGLGGTVNLLSHGSWRVPKAVFALSTPLVLVLFWFLGARAYATDVRFIERELVDVARWLREETPPQAIVATHDIGAIGYFSQRTLVDIAGLANPEVIPFIDDEERLLAYLEEKKVDYFVTFPSWYPTIVASPNFRLIYRTDHPWTVAAGFENNAIYETLW